MQKMTEEQKKLVEDNLPLSTYTLKIIGYPVTDDNLSICYIALCKASISFNEHKGKFSTYATRIIKNEFAMQYRKTKAGSRIPENMKISINQDIYYNQNGDNITLEDTIKNDENIEELIFNKIIINDFYKFLNKIKQRDKEIVISNIFKDEKQNAIAKRFEISQSYVQRIIKNTIKKFSIEYGYTIK